MARSLDLFAIEVVKAHEENAQSGDASQDIDLDTYSAKLRQNAQMERAEKPKKKDERIKLLAARAYRYIKQETEEENTERWLREQFESAKSKNFWTIALAVVIVAIVSCIATFYLFGNVMILFRFTVPHWWLLETTTILIVFSLPDKSIKWAFGIFALIWTALFLSLPGGWLFKLFLFAPVLVLGVLTLHHLFIRDTESTETLIGYFKSKTKKFQTHLRKTLLVCQKFLFWKKSKNKEPNRINEAVKTAMEKLSLLKFAVACCTQAIGLLFLVVIWLYAEYSIHDATGTKDIEIKYTTRLSVSERKRKVDRFGAPVNLLFKKPLPCLNAIKWAGNDDEKEEALNTVSTNNIVQVGSGTQLSDGDTITVTSNNGVTTIFEFDTKDGVKAGNILVAFTDGSDGAPDPPSEIASKLQLAIQDSDTGLTAKLEGDLVSINGNGLNNGEGKVKLSSQKDALKQGEETKTEREHEWRRVWMDFLLDAHVTYNILPRSVLLLLLLGLLFCFKRDGEPNLNDDYYTNKLNELLGPEVKETPAKEDAGEIPEDTAEETPAEEEVADDNEETAEETPAEKEVAGDNEQEEKPDLQLQENWFVGYLAAPQPEDGWKTYATKSFKVDQDQQIEGQSDSSKLRTDLKSARAKIRRLVLFVSAIGDSFEDFLGDLILELDDSFKVFVAVTEVDKLIIKYHQNKKKVKEKLDSWQAFSVDAGVHREHFREWGEIVPERFTEWLDDQFGLRWPGCHEEALELLNKKACEIVSDSESNHDLKQESEKLHREIHKLYLADYNGRKIKLDDLRIKDPGFNLPNIGEIKENIADMGRKFQVFITDQITEAKDAIKGPLLKAKWLAAGALLGVVLGPAAGLAKLGAALMGAGFAEIARNVFSEIKQIFGPDSPDLPKITEQDDGDAEITMTDDKRYQLADLIRSNAIWILYLQLQGSGEMEISRALDRAFETDDLPDDPLQTGDEISQLTEELKKRFSSEVQRMRPGG